MSTNLDATNGSFRLLRFGEVRPAGWIHAQMMQDLTDGFAGHLHELTDHAANDLFRNRIGTSTDEIQWWDSETRGNWMIGLTQMAYLANHPAAIELVEQFIADLKATQDEDGYIGIYVPSSRFQHPPGENGELWGQSRALLALLAHYELTGDCSSLEAAERAARLTMSQYGPHHPYFVIDPKNGYLYLTGMTHGLMFVDVMEWLYAITGDVAYRDFGVWLYQDFCSVPGHFKNDDLKLEHIANPGLGLRAHSAHTAEHLRVLLWSAFVTGDEELAASIAPTFRKLIRYIVPSGALIGDEDIHGLPVPDIGYEYCTMFELMNSLLSAAEKYGASGYGDWAENIVLNAGQGARFADGRAICYMSKENRSQALASDLDTYSAPKYQFAPAITRMWVTDPEKHWQHGGRYKYSPTHEDVAVCCNPNAVRFMPHYVSRMWMRSTRGDGLVASQYGPCVVTTEIAGATITIEEETDYPFAESIRFVVRQAEGVACDLLLRLPTWAAGYDITAAGAEISAEDGYLRLRKRWMAGDEITLSFTARIELIHAANGEYTVRRGPLQYAMPIEHALRPFKDYAVAAFHDYDIVPRELEDACVVPILDGTQPDWGCVFRRHAPVGERPWDEPPVTIQLGEFSLVPIGCTVLRRSTLPLRSPGRAGVPAG
jgi:uncharacterized protein